MDHFGHIFDVGSQRNPYGIRKHIGFTFALHLRQFFLEIFAQFFGILCSFFFGGVCVLEFIKYQLLVTE